jgi:hypothetical protein
MVLDYRTAIALYKKILFSLGIYKEIPYLCTANRYYDRRASYQRRDIWRRFGASMVGLYKNVHEEIP